MEEIHKGLIVYRASRLEGLLEALTYFIDKHPPADVLAPQTVIAAHPGMKQWLSSALARSRGPGGIAANLDIVLPSAWLDRLARQRLGKSAVALSAYQRGSLRWRIHELLDGLDAPQVRAYLQGDDRARRRFQLADRLARLYTQYIVYRPDWLEAWAAGTRPVPPRESPGPHRDFVAALWARLRKDTKLAHRGELLELLLRKLQEPSSTPPDFEPVHVFGISHLAPSELKVLAAVAVQQPVVLYLPDPCREYWLDQRSDREALRDQVRQDPYGQQTESLFLEQGHPLLGAWGRLGQHFMVALEGLDIAVDVRHWQDKGDAGLTDTRLQRVQESIRRLEPGLLPPVGDAETGRADASLRVHACHTRLRELEVLRDALLKALRDDDSLQPSSIVVMAPDIQAYLPLLPAVFGEAGRHDGPLPYHLADVPVARSHSLFEAFRKVLDLPRSRLTAPEIVDLLSVPEIARRLDLGSGDVDVLSGWLRNSRVAWALDPQFRSDLGVPPIVEHSFAWGMDRMMAGYVMGAGGDTEVDAVTLPDGTALAPLGGIQGPQAALLGALDGVLVQLAQLHADGKRSLRASAWAQRLEQAFEALFRIDRMDAGARDAEALLRRFIRSIATEPRQAGQDPTLEFGVVRELLLERMDAAPERQRFLMGGVTFCGMVPQRAIPFRVVAVLGLNDGEFPRGGSDGGLDLMATNRRLGDRDVRSDDRYLFLETVMSARDRLHLSYIGEGVRDGKPRNPAAPLAELLAALRQAAVDQAATGTAGSAEALQQPWWIRHPLQPFDDRYFDGSDPALFSFRKDFAGMEVRDGRGEPALQFVDDANEPGPGAVVDDTPAEGAAAPIPITEVFAYYRDPARQLLANGLKLRLDALDSDSLLDCEPLEASFEAIDRVATRVFNAVVATPDRQVPDSAPDWVRLGGLLPPGSIGDAAWAQERDKVIGLLDAIGECALFQPALPPPTPLPIDRGLGGHRLQGELRRVHDAAGVRWIHAAFPGKGEDELHFKHRVDLFLEWALARLEDPQGQRSVRACVLTPIKPSARKQGVDKGEWQRAFDHWDEAFMAAVRSGDIAQRQAMLADLETRVIGLLDFWCDAQRTPVWYFPATSWLAIGEDDTGRCRAASKWLGGWERTGERDYAPGYARLLAGERAFDTPAEYARLRDTARRLRKLITLGEPAGEGA